MAQWIGPMEDLQIFHRFSHGIWGFPVIFPLNQSISGWEAAKNGGFIRLMILLPFKCPLYGDSRSPILNFKVHTQTSSLVVSPFISLLWVVEPMILYTLKVPTKTQPMHTMPKTPHDPSLATLRPHIAQRGFGLPRCVVNTLWPQCVHCGRRSSAD